jgi:hypothetical protein
MSYTLKNQDDPTCHFMNFDLTDSLLTLQAEKFVHPMGHYIHSTLISKRYTRRTVKQRSGIKDVVNTLITT